MAVVNNGFGEVHLNKLEEPDRYFTGAYSAKYLLELSDM